MLAKSALKQQKIQCNSILDKQNQPYYTKSKRDIP